jgi:hypothetical protein
VVAVSLVAAPLFATISPSVPEVSGSSLGLGLGLLATTVALIRARYPRR